MIAEEAIEILSGTLKSDKLGEIKNTDGALCLEITGKVPSHHSKLIPAFYPKFSDLLLNSAYIRLKNRIHSPPTVN